MKKLVIAAMALALSAGANAQNAGGESTFAFGEITTAKLIAAGVSLSVIAAIASNMGGVTLPDEIEFELKCDEGDAAPVNGVCTTTVTGTTTATVSVSGTITNTVTAVPVIVTYPATLVPVN